MLSKRLRQVAFGLMIGGGLLVAGIYWMNRSSQPPDNIGAAAGRLAPCPDSPNCVSTRASDPQHAIEPFSYSGDSAEAMGVIREVIQSLPRTHIVSESDTYLHVEFTSLVLRFVDDVEFLIDATEKKVHFRSASRVGHSDLGVNRKRMEKIRTLYQKHLESS